MLMIISGFVWPTSLSAEVYLCQRYISHSTHGKYFMENPCVERKAATWRPIRLLIILLLSLLVFRVFNTRNSVMFMTIVELGADLKSLFANISMICLSF